MQEYQTEKGNIIENRHTGIARQEIKKMSLPEPEFESLRGDFKVIFRKEKIKLEIKTGQKDKNEFVLKSTQIKILELIENNPYITQNDISQILKIGRTTVTENIKKLKDFNIIKRVGSDRKGYWEKL